MDIINGIIGLILILTIFVGKFIFRWGGIILIILFLYALGKRQD